MPELDPTTGSTFRFTEGCRVYCDTQQFEGLVLRDEEWGDTRVPVLVFDDTEDGTVMVIPVGELTLI